MPGVVIANSTMYFATGPEVIQLFLPLMTQLPLCVLRGARVHRGRIGARLRLGQRIRADRLAGGDRAHVFLLLLLGAVLAGCRCRTANC